MTLLDPTLNRSRGGGPAHLTDLLNTVGPGLVRWCTPSVLPTIAQVCDPYRADLSVSYGPAGSMLDHSGLFGAAERFIAGVHGADRAFLVPAGSTAANQILVRALDRARAPGVVLVDRQAHHSVVNALNAASRRWRYLSTGRWDEQFECPLPVRADDVAATIDEVVAAGEAVAAVVVVSPTYAGEIADIRAIAAAVESHAAAIHLHVDEAWGAHLAFMDDCAPFAAARCGAHTISQSTHKQGGALQPGAVLLHNAGPLAFEPLDAAYRDVMSTSASYLIAASVEAAHRALAEDGPAWLGRSVALTERLAAGLRRVVPDGVLLLDARAGRLAPVAVASDPTKTTIALPAGRSGYELADGLAERGIAVEKATPATITFLTTFSLDAAGVDRTLDAVRGALGEAPVVERHALLPDPFRHQSPVPDVLPGGRAIGATEVVSIADAVGRVAAECIEAYPPGIAVVSEGYRISAGAVTWLQRVADAGGTIVGRDPTLAAVSVFR